MTMPISKAASGALRAELRRSSWRFPGEKTHDDGFHVHAGTQAHAEREARVPEALPEGSRRRRGVQDPSSTPLHEARRTPMTDRYEVALPVAGGRPAQVFDHEPFRFAVASDARLGLAHRANDGVVVPASRHEPEDTGRAGRTKPRCTATASPRSLPCISPDDGSSAYSISIDFALRGLVSLTPGRRRPPWRRRSRNAARCPPTVPCVMTMGPGLGEEASTVGARAARARIGVDHHGDIDIRARYCARVLHAAVVRDVARRCVALVIDRAAQAHDGDARGDALRRRADRARKVFHS